MNLVEYVYNKKERIVSPIWGGYKELTFLTLGYLEYAKAFGLEVYEATEFLNLVRENQLPTEEKLDDFIKDNKFDYTIFQNEVDSLRELRNTTPNILGGGTFGPLTVVSNILGAENTLRKIRKEPRMIEKFLKHVTNYMEELAVLENNAYQDFFWIAEPLASLLSPKLFWDFCGKYLNRIVMKVKGTTILHVCGPTLKLTNELLRTGAKILSIDYVTSLEETLKMVSKDVVIMGNIDPSILHFGTREEIVKEIGRINEVTKSYKNFIFSTGCVIQSGTPVENVELMFSETKSFYDRNN